ncbi:PAS domain-containing protein [Undibacterium pigrum]|uniref:PAS domain S-box-containing protein n=1 Tax=Undibacterium pigrum TaxID=401470 RepID=A0A318JMP4_9BURK|nr:PAS domain-containing protein [Undibacterium pigrum]PXX41552.1 PAS domain S-box-containing protein [Undibacterium pigrum]
MESKETRGASQDVAALALFVIDNSPAMMAYWNSDLICQFSNDAYADWFGKSRAEMKGIAMRDALGEIFMMNRKEIQGALDGEKQVFERAVRVADGSLRHSLMTYTPRFKGGRVHGFFVHVADVTPLKLAEVELKSAYAELKATQILLSDAIRENERVRIARDLHDVLGHHLTALNLHLDLALRQTLEQDQHAVSSKSLAISRDLAQNLLNQVRAVVAMERSNHVSDLRQALQSLCSAIPDPLITLEFASNAELQCPVLVHTIFSCVQEAITNCIRHARAKKLHIHLARQQDGIILLMVDDGKGISKDEQGHGLSGMRERVNELGGRMHISSQPDEGFHIHIWLPQKEGQA